MCHSAQRWRTAATLGGRRKRRTTLKELHRGGGFDATHSRLIKLGIFSQGSPESIQGYRWADGFESRLDSVQFEHNMPVMDTRAWKPQNNPEGAMHSLSNILCRIEARSRHALPNLHTGHTMLVVSDYSGQHATANFETLSFLIADSEKCGDWEQHRKRCREQHLAGGGITRTGFVHILRASIQNGLIRLLNRGWMILTVTNPDAFSSRMSSAFEKPISCVLESLAMR